MDAVPYNLADWSTIPRPGLACDVDESLSDTVVYWMQYLGEVLGNPENLTPRELVTRYGFSFNVPYWKDLPNYWETVEPLWHDNEFQRKLPILPGVPEALACIHAAVGISCYATTRPITVHEGTRDWIRIHGLPEVEMLMRPLDVGFKEADRAKVEAVVKLYPTVTGLIDDKAAVVNLFPPDYKGIVYHFGADLPVRTDIRVVACRDWRTLAQEVTRSRVVPLNP